jgi:hypothetical protein
LTIKWGQDGLFYERVLSAFGRLLELLTFTLIGELSEDATFVS